MDTGFAQIVASPPPKGAPEPDHNNYFVSHPPYTVGRIAFAPAPGYTDGTLATAHVDITALAYRLARIAWAVINPEEDFDSDDALTQGLRADLIAQMRKGLAR